MAIFEKVSGEYKVVVDYDQFPIDPRDWAIDKMVIRNNRHYSFPQEIDFDWSKYDEWKKAELNKLKKRYHIFFLDCYIHSWVSFSFAWHWMQCRFDTAKDAWFIAVPKCYNGYDSREISETPYKVLGWHYEPHKVRKPQAIEIARLSIEEYNAYLNWEFYRVDIYDISDEEEEFLDGDSSYKAKDLFLPEYLKTPEHKDLVDAFNEFLKNY